MTDSHPTTDPIRGQGVDAAVRTGELLGFARQRNVVVYRDTGSHLRATFASTLAPPIETALKQALTAG